MGKSPITATSPSSANKLCQFVANPGGSNVPFTVACPYNLRGRYVSIQRVQVTGTLTLCEVQVFTSTSLPPAPPSPSGSGNLNNLAQGRPAFMSGAALVGGQTLASRAVDGMTNTLAGTHPFCAVTSSQDPWW